MSVSMDKDQLHDLSVLVDRLNSALDWAKRSGIHVDGALYLSTEDRNATPAFYLSARCYGEKFVLEHDA